MTLIAPPKIGKDERRARIENLCAEMDKDGIGAVLIGPTASLRYFTGVNWHPSERFTGALVRADGTVEYITPGFERDKVAAVIGIQGDIFTWQEGGGPGRRGAGGRGGGARGAGGGAVAL